MLTNFSIENFKSIKKANLPLGKITTITGPSETGKSNLTRALIQLFYNGGCDMEEACFHGTKGFKLSAEMSDGGSAHVVDFYKVKKLKKSEEKDWMISEKNRYTISTESYDDPSKYEDKFDKPGIYVPPMIEKLFQMQQVEFDKDLKVSLNCRPQHEPILFLNLSTDKKTLLMGKISPVLNTLSSAYKAAVTDTKSAEMLLKRKIEPQIAENETNLEIFKKKKTQLEIALVVENQIKEYVDSFQMLIDLLETHISIEQSLVEADTALSKVQVEQQLVKHLEKSYDELVFFLDYAQIRRDLEGVESAYLSAVEYKEIMDLLVDELQTQSQVLEDLIETKDSLTIAEEDLILVEEKMKEMDQRYKILEEEIQKIYTDFSVCSVCGAEKEHWNIKE